MKKDAELPAIAFVEPIERCFHEDPEQFLRQRRCADDEPPRSGKSALSTLGMNVESLEIRGTATLVQVCAATPNCRGCSVGDFCEAFRRVLRSSVWQKCLVRSMQSGNG